MKRPNPGDTVWVPLANWGGLWLPGLVYSIWGDGYFRVLVFRETTEEWAQDANVSGEGTTWRWNVEWPSP